MIFQPMGGGSGGGLSVVASGTAYSAINFDRRAVCVFASPRDAEAGSTSGFCLPGRSIYISPDGTEQWEIELDSSGTRLYIRDNNRGYIQYLALG